MKTYQYHDPRYHIEDDDGTRWIAAHSESAANEFADTHGWEPCGGEIYGEAETAEMLDDIPERGGIDTVIDDDGEHPTILSVDPADRLE